MRRLRSLFFAAAVVAVAPSASSLAAEDVVISTLLANPKYYQPQWDESALIDPRDAWVVAGRRVISVDQSKIGEVVSHYSQLKSLHTSRAAEALKPYPNGCIAVLTMMSRFRCVALPVPPKSEFETTAEYEGRVSKAQAQADENVAMLKSRLLEQVEVEGERSRDQVLRFRMSMAMTGVYDADRQEFVGLFTAGRTVAVAPKPPPTTVPVELPGGLTLHLTGSTPKEAKCNLLTVASGVEEITGTWYPSGGFNVAAGKYSVVRAEAQAFRSALTVGKIELILYLLPREETCWEAMGYLLRDGTPLPQLLEFNPRFRTRGRLRQVTRAEIEEADFQAR